jgi:hypothetical protein
VAENRTFFCSELVVELYKAVGAFNTKKNSASFFPNDLAVDNSKLPLAIGAKLSEPLRIIVR